MAPVYKDARIARLKGRAWLAIPLFENHLLDELKIPHTEKPMGITALPKDGVCYGDIIYREKYKPAIYWHRLCMEEPFTACFSSISEAAELLRSVQRNWAFYPFTCFRRAELIEKKLPFISKKEKTFPFETPLAEMGLWTLLNENTLFASAKTSSPFPRGELFLKKIRRIRRVARILKCGKHSRCSGFMKEKIRGISEMVNTRPHFLLPVPSA